MNLFIFGLGYTARCFVQGYGDRFASIAATRRPASAAASKPEPGTRLFAWQGALPDAAMADAIEAADVLLVSAPPGPDGDRVLSACTPAIERANRVRSIIYLSTIGVYGDRDGGWVDESAPPAPASARSRLRVLAEEQWTALALRMGERKGADENTPEALRLHILRLAGIYGPGRSAIDNLRKGTARRIVKPRQVFNRIHVVDAAQAIARCLEHCGGEWVNIWNVTDDEPAPPQDVIAHGADLLGLEPPPEIAFERAELSPMAASFYAENKRASNTRLKQELGVELAYPTYREGLRALLQPPATRAAYETL